GRKKLGQTIPFGPFLALGSVVVIFWGDKILNWYLSLKI
ncbi:prepilin peptidase, partial [Candidatus Daviesbacteria bacterium]|nr:prepilin peptidase [Candidatus Daviesbacteria bacterium]